MTSTEKLVERLKAIAYLKVRPAPASDGVTVIASYFTHQDAALCAEAADALEAQASRIAELEAALEEIARFPNPPTVSWERANAVLRRAASARGRA